MRRCPLYQDMKEGVTPGGIEYYLPMFFEQTATLFDYLADSAVFLLGEGALESAEQFWTQTGERYDQRAHDIERPVLPPAEFYLPPELLREQLNKRLRSGAGRKRPRARAAQRARNPRRSCHSTARARSPAPRCVISSPTTRDAC